MATALQVLIPAGFARLIGDLMIPEGSTGIVIFAHGGMNNRHNEYNQTIASVLQKNGMATLIMDLLSSRESAIDRDTDHIRFNIELLRQRLMAATFWVVNTPELVELSVGYFAANTGAAAALAAAAEHPEIIKALVCVAGRPDLVESILPRVKSPTLFIAGGDDYPVLDLNHQAMLRMGGRKKLVTVDSVNILEDLSSAGHVAALASEWLKKSLVGF